MTQALYAHMNNKTIFKNYIFQKHDIDQLYQHTISEYE
jgi:hypothetical protein